MNQYIETNERIKIPGSTIKRVVYMKNNTKYIKCAKNKSGFQTVDSAKSKKVGGTRDPIPIPISENTFNLIKRFLDIILEFKGERIYNLPKNSNYYLSYKNSFGIELKEYYELIERNKIVSIRSEYDSKSNTNNFIFILKNDITVIATFNPTSTTNTYDFEIEEGLHLHLML